MFKSHKVGSPYFIFFSFLIEKPSWASSQQLIHSNSGFILLRVFCHRHQNLSSAIKRNGISLTLCFLFLIFDFCLFIICIQFLLYVWYVIQFNCKSADKFINDILNNKIFFFINILMLCITFRQKKHMFFKVFWNACYSINNLCQKEFLNTENEQKKNIENRTFMFEIFALTTTTKISSFCSFFFDFKKNFRFWFISCRTLYCCECFRTLKQERRHSLLLKMSMILTKLINKSHSKTS